MPFFSDEQSQVALPKAIGDDELPDLTPEPDFKEQLRAAYRLENTLGSFVSQESGLPDSTVTNPDFNPIDYFTPEEMQDDKFLDNAILADSVEEIEAVRRQQARERSDRQTLERGGIAAVGLATITDPINLIPVGGTAYKTYRSGASILAGGMATASVAASSTAAAESLLLHTQIERTYGEAAVNVAASAFLGGVLGVTPVGLKKLMSDSGVESQKLFDDVANTFDPESKVNAGFNPSAPLGDTSMGAASVMDDPIVRGKLARAVTKFVGFDPLSRSITSDEVLTRRVSADLAENPIDVEGGIARTSVESHIKTYDGYFFNAYNKYEPLYKQYKLEGGDLTEKEFREAVSKAIRNGSPNKHIQEAANIWDAEVYQPIKKRAIDEGMLPEDVSVDTAENYLNRIWNKEKVSRNLDKFVEVTTRWLMSTDDKLSKFEADGLSRQIAGRIMSTPDGRLPYDYDIKANDRVSAKQRSSLSGTFKARSFNIPDDMVEDFLENDIEEVAYRYIKSTAPDIELMKKFGDVDMTQEIGNIEASYNRRIEAAQKAGDTKLSNKLIKARKRDIESIAAMRDRIRGTYNVPQDPDNPWLRIQRSARDLNYMRLLGGVVAASIPDLARVVGAEGIVRTFKDGLLPLATNLKAFKVAAKEAKQYGIALDSLVGGRSEILADVADYSKGGTAVERGIRAAANKFSTINLMNHWTSGIKQLHAVVAQTRMIDDMSKGVYDKRLLNLGIDENMFSDIAEQMKKHAKKIDGVWVANSSKWDDAEAVLTWQAAMRKESDRVIIVPGQERPLFMSTEAGKTFFQFKTFMFSATQRILISNLQRQDKHYMQGMIGMVSLGMLSYAFKQWDSGREITDDPKTLVVEGIDRSGVLGILMEANNTLEKISSNNLGMRPILGISAPASRYASRSVAEGAMGPTFGLLGDTVKTANAIANGQDWLESDTRALRRLLPGQNLSIIRQGLDEIESGVNKSLGVN